MNTSPPQLWEPIPANSNEAILELQDPEHWWTAYVKWDGCINLYNAGNVPYEHPYGLAGDNRDDAAADCYFHICDLDDMIARLQTIKHYATQYFGEWPN